MSRRRFRISRLPPVESILVRWLGSLSLVQKQSLHTSVRGHHHIGIALPTRHSWNKTASGRHIVSF